MDFHSFVSVTSMVAASLVALLTSPVSSPVSGSAILNERVGKTSRSHLKDHQALEPWRHYCLPLVVCLVSMEMRTMMVIRRHTLSQSTSASRLTGRKNTRMGLVHWTWCTLRRQHLSCYDDLPHELYVKMYDGSFNFNDKLLGHTDIQKMRRGQIGGQF
jgi:hypothetical protein